jgi:hypothetical protein
MNKRSGLPIFLASFLVFCGIARGREQEQGIFRDISLKFGLGTGFVSRTVRWDSDESTIKAFTVGLASEFEFPYSLTASLFAGLGLTNYQGALFDHLPITIQYEAGAVGSLVFGGEVRKKIKTFGDFETGASATFVTSIGMNKTWPLSGFAVTGKAQGTPDWAEFDIGPTISYLGYRGFVPYLGIQASWFWGKFKMAETLEDLEGSQTRTFKQKGLIKITLGAAGAITHRLSFRGEAAIVPAGGRVDLGAALRILYAF